MKSPYNYSQKKSCIDCGSLICNVASRCKKCSTKLYAKRGKDSHFYKDGRASIVKICPDFGNKLLRYYANRCRKCTGLRKRKYYFCADCGIKISSKNAKRCRACFSKNISGQGNPSYIDGRSFKKYGRTFDGTLKELIRVRDQYRCKICGLTQSENGCQLDIHHIDQNKFNNRTDNLIALCKAYHTKVHNSIDVGIEGNIL